MHIVLMLSLTALLLGVHARWIYGPVGGTVHTVKGPGHHHRK